MALSKAQMRVKIAKDVLLNLKSENVKVTKETYVWFEDNMPHEVCELQPYLKEKNPACHVCALGAMLLSRIRCFDNFKRVDMSSEKYISGAQTKHGLYKYFDADQICLIEAFFEQWRSYFKPSEQDLMDKFPDPKERLIFIMKHIIRHKGTFKYGRM